MLSNDATPCFDTLVCSDLAVLKALLACQAILVSSPNECVHVSQNNTT